MVKKTVVRRSVSVLQFAQRTSILCIWKLGAKRKDKLVMATAMTVENRYGAAKHPYIHKKPEIANNKAVIIGTRIKVTQIAFEVERLGWTPDQIVDAHPHLTLPQVHDALSYYYENQQELDREMIAEEKATVNLRQQYPPKATSCVR